MFQNTARCWWLAPKIQAMWEAESWPQKMAGEVAQVVECQPIKHEVQVPVPTKQNKL
jgi:hypothetical protein